MIKVEFLGPINKKSISIDISNLNQLKDILQKDKDMEDWLKNSAIAVNDNIITDINKELKNGDIISLLPPVCGG